jgi:MFS family permease
MIVLGLFEGTAFAMAVPAIFLLVARASPTGRSSTAQGIIGASGTTGTIVASILAGTLAATDLRLPFWVTGSVTLVCLACGLLLGRRRLYDAMQPRPAAAPSAPPASEVAF